MNVVLIPAYDRENEIKALFSEYTDMLIKGDRKFADYLKLQNYNNELTDLESKYGLPDGRLLLALCNGEAAGCIALRKISETECEMKRLYVRPQFRKNGIAKMLVNRIIDDATEIGYKHILLDTLPFLETAIDMYKRMGFYEIPSYNNSPMDNLIYLKYDL